MSVTQDNVQMIEEPLDLKLFVAGRLERSTLIESNVRKVLEQEFPDGYRLDVIDVIEDPRAAEAQNVSLTPTLIFANANPPRRLVGLVHRREQILWLIDRSTRKSVPTTDGLKTTLADRCPDGIVLINDDGEVIESNVAARALLGFSDRPASGEIFGLPLTDGSTVNLVLPNGIPVELAVSSTSWNGQNAHLAVVRDRSSDAFPVSQNQPARLEKENEALQSAMEQAARSMAAMQETAADLERSKEELLQFAHRAAHDLSAPGVTMQNIVSFLLEDEADRLSEGGKDLLNNLEKTSGRLVAMTNALLDFSQASISARESEAVDMNKVVHWVLSDLKPEIEKSNASLAVGDLPVVTGAQMQLYQVFLNLIGNALKYRRPEVSPLIEVFAIEPENPTPLVRQICVRDNGTGFDNQYAEQIFQPFERLVAASDVPGSGIGLATVKRILEASGASIQAEGVPGSGATFTISFPTLESWR